MKIYFIRHAQVPKRYMGRYIGHLDIPLAKEGKEAAKELAKQLAHIPFDKVYCSDLLRAKETLAAFDLASPIIYTQALREKSWGRHEGASFEEITKEGIAYSDFTSWVSLLDGEPLDRYAKRVREFFYSTLLQSRSNHTLVITHAGFIKTLLASELALSYEEAFSISLPYCGTILYDTSDGFALDQAKKGPIGLKKEHKIC